MANFTGIPNANANRGNRLRINPSAPRFISSSPVATSMSAAPGSIDRFSQFNERVATGSPSETRFQQKRTQDIAFDAVQKSSGITPLNEFGMPKTERPDFTSQYLGNLNSIHNRGVSATGTEQAKNQWAQLKRAQDLFSNYNPDQVSYSIAGGVADQQTPLQMPAGASANNPGAKAVALAMQAYNNKTPYVWGGNSLVKGIDCSGLVQQVYSQLGIQIPRTTYEQAKSGRVVNLNQLVPGDLVFYNTGGRDPNGVGVNSHVALYIGNGKVVDARNTKSGMKVGNIGDPGMPSTAVRPW